MAKKSKKKSVAQPKQPAARKMKKAAAKKPTAAKTKKSKKPAPKRNAARKATRKPPETAPGFLSRIMSVFGGN